MKTQKLLLIFISSFLFLQNINAQYLMFKGTAALVVADLSVLLILDTGIEIKITEQFTGQLSYSKSYFGNGYTRRREKTIWTPQLRYYLKKDSWSTSPYIGILLQKHVGRNEEFDDTSVYDHKIVTFKRLGAGFIFGHHIKIYKRLGIDIHIGALGEKGDESTMVTAYPSRQVTVDKVEIGKTNARIFAGFNFYLAIGKINSTTKKIIKNTEGSL